MKVKTSSYETSKEILRHDLYVAIPYQVMDTGVSADSDGKKIVKAGTILPANDATAKGVLLYDTDVTYGSKPAALVIFGFIDAAKMPEEAEEAAKTALPMVQFLTDEVIA